MAEAMGWPDVQPSWRDILLLARDEQGWGRYKRDWGAFRLGKTNPNISTSGIHSLIAAYYAATGKSKDLTKEDLTDNAADDFVRDIESSVSHYAPTVASFLDNMAAADSLSYISAIAVEEQEVFHYNEGGHSRENPQQPPRISLAAVYPSGVTLLADHPYIVLQAPWVNDSKRRIAAKFLDWLPSQESRFANAGFRDGRHEASAVLAKEEGIVADQPRAVLDLPDDPQVVAAIRERWKSIRKRAQVLIVLAATDQAQRADVHTTIAELSDRDQVAVWTFKSGCPGGPLRPWSLPGERESLLHDIDAAPLGTNRVPLNCAIGSAYRTLVSNRDPGRINAVVVITAARDDGSGKSLTELERELRAPSPEPPIRVYTVALRGSDSSALLGIAKASGGVTTSGSAAVAIRTVLGNF